MSYNDTCYGYLQRDLGSHASNLAGSHVAHSIKIIITKGLIRNSITKGQILNLPRWIPMKYLKN